MKKPIVPTHIQWLHIIAGGSFILLIIWLALSPPPTASKWEAISKELIKGTIGTLSPQQTKALEETLAWLVPQAGVNGRFILNGEPKPGVLHIFTTTPAAFAVTGCARGNALYDAQLDAVFIDEQIISPNEIIRLGENSPGLHLSLEEFTFIPIYLRFIILHELGHRQLHRKSGGAFFDFNNGSRKMEEEADKFAILKMKQAYQLDLKTGAKRIGKGAEQFIQLDSGSINSNERVWADLIGAASSMSLVMMYSASDFSSFYEDAAHPNFIVRANSILTAALNASETRPALKARAAIYLRYLERIANLSKLHFAEIQLQDGSQRVTFTKDKLIVLSSLGAIFTVPITDIKNSLCRSNSPIHLQQAQAPKIDLKGNPDMASMSKMWAHPLTGLVILQPAPDEESPTVEVQGLQQGRLIQLTSLRSTLLKDSIGAKLFRPFIPWWKGGTDYDKDVFLPPQPATAAVLGNGDKFAKKLLLLREGQITHQVNLDSIATQIGSELKSSSISLTISTVTDSVAYITVFERFRNHDQLKGVAELNLLTGNLNHVLKLHFVDKDGHDMVSINNDKLVVIPGQKPRYVLFTRNRIHLLIFELLPDKPAIFIAERSFLFDSVLTQQDINSDVLGSFDPILKDVTFVPPKYAVATFDNDSIYFTDLNTGQINTLFSPGNFTNMAVSKDGLLAFFVNNGRKIYVLHSSDLL